MDKNRRKSIMDMFEQRNELVILCVYSVFTIIMFVGVAILGLPVWIIPTVIIGLAISWILYINESGTYETRAIFTSFMVMMNYTIYGICAENFTVIIPTLSMGVLLLGFYGLPEIMRLEVAVTLGLLLFHAIVKKNIEFTGVFLEDLRMVLELVSIFTIEFLTWYLIKEHEVFNRKQEEMIVELRRAERSKRDFLSNVSHELRTPINTVTGMCEIMLDEENSEHTKKELADIHGAGRQLMSLVSNILDFSELEDGTMDVIEKQYSPSGVIADVANVVMPIAKEQGIELIIDFDSNVPSLLLGDELKIRRIITNLVLAALRFTSEGCIIISVNARAEDYGVNLSVAVEDTGNGIGQDIVDNLFSKVFVLDTRKDDERTSIGLGLSLAITKALVRAMGGFITATSKLGRGTVCQFVIPQKVADATPSVQISNPDNLNVLYCLNAEKFEIAMVRDAYYRVVKHIIRNSEVKTRQCRNISDIKRRISMETYTHLFINWAEYCVDPEFFESLVENLEVFVIMDDADQFREGSRMHPIFKPVSVTSAFNAVTGVYSTGTLAGFYRLKHFSAPDAAVLVVDDNIMNLKVAEGLLKKYRIEIDTAISGVEALVKVENRRYDLIFMDHMMPEMDGVETLHNLRLKSEPYLQHVPVVALTANAIGGAREMFISEGFQDFLSKPIEITMMENILCRYLPENKIIPADEKYMLQRQSRYAAEVQPESDTETKFELDGIDIEGALQYYDDDIADYMDVARIYHDTGLKKIEEIKECYDNEDWKNYTILVHSVKSTSLNVGANDLSAMAKDLEAAGKKEDGAFIKDNHLAMMTEYLRVLDVMGANRYLYPDGQDDPSVSGADAGKDQSDSGEIRELNNQEWEAFIGELAEALASYEPEKAESVFRNHSNCRYVGKPLELILAPVCEYMDDFDFPQAVNELEKLKGGAES